jgi:SAM-dependent methyltransferase
MSACALEHFSNHIQAISEMVRVLRPGGRLAMSVDAITRGNRYPSLFANHEARYHVVRTFDRDTLTSELTNLGLTVDQATYIFRGPNQGIYLVASRLSPSWSWNALAAFAPITAAIDRLSRDDNGAILLVNTTKTPT